MRCPTCLQIEAWSRQAIDAVFKEELADGRLEWHAVNIEQPGNEHFEEDYHLTAQSLVLVRCKDGRRADWKNLKKVWDWVEDYRGFTKYVQREMAMFLIPPESATSQEDSDTGDEQP